MTPSPYASNHLLVKLKSETVIDASHVPQSSEIESFAKLHQITHWRPIFPSQAAHHHPELLKSIGFLRGFEAFSYLVMVPSPNRQSVQ